MFKRGQITIFIILGIVIIIAVIFGVVMRKEIVKAVSSSEDKEAISFSEQSAEVKKHVEGCLEQSLNDAVFNSNIGSSPSITSFDDYYAQIAILVKDKAEECINFNQFKPLIITRDQEMALTVYGDTNVPPTKIVAEAKFKVDISKEPDQSSYSEFIVTLPLKGGITTSQ
ncbi:MAG: hypothetical protein WC852_00555 [Candidatus Nanoarchaeia archaeon]|jgi:hypothetical protein